MNSRYTWDTADELDQIKKIGSFTELRKKRSKLEMLKNYKDGLKTRTNWRNLDKGSIMDFIEDEIKNEIKNETKKMIIGAQ